LGTEKILCDSWRALRFLFFNRQERQDSARNAKRFIVLSGLKENYFSMILIRIKTFTEFLNEVIILKNIY